MVKHKRVTDPVHGNIQLSELETKIVSSRAFQRLHNVRQLGLAYYVFPGANYSRLSHSLGACHNASRMIDAARINCGSDSEKIKKIDELEQSLRLSALLHDIGHYPFSHATEHVVKDFYSQTLMEPSSAASPVTSDSQPLAKPRIGIDHEGLGRKVLEHDKELSAIFSAFNFDSDKIKSIFSNENPENSLVEIITSDLDCDRLDYLKRTSHHTGLPYGGVDTEFLVSQAAVDSDFRFCYTRKALRAADHLLVSRYYDYLQVPFHKTVCALEWSLTESINALLRKGIIACSSEDMIEKIENGSWHDFDDNYFFTQFRALLEAPATKTDEPVLADHLKAVLHRKPASCILFREAVISHGDEKLFNRTLKLLDNLLLDFARRKGIDAARFKVWRHKVVFAKYRADAATEEVGAARILNVHGTQSTPLCGLSQALFAKLVECKHVGLRVFYLPATPLATTESSALMQDLESYLSAEGFLWPFD